MGLLAQQLPACAVVIIPPDEFTRGICSLNAKLLGQDKWKMHYTERDILRVPEMSARGDMSVGRGIKSVLYLQVAAGISF